MPAFSETTLKPEDVLSLAAYLKDPVAGEGNPENPQVNRAAPPPPAGQTRFYGQFGLLSAPRTAFRLLVHPGRRSSLTISTPARSNGAGRLERHPVWRQRESRIQEAPPSLETAP